MAEGNENLISIDEVIARAKKLGVDFGKGDSRNRLRYYTKIGLLPNAQRKCFENNFPQGAYSESVINLLVEIDKKIKEGKTIQAIKKEIEKDTKREEEVKKKTEERLFETPFASAYVYPQPKIEEEILFEEKLKPGFKIPAFLKLLLIILILASMTFFVKAKVNIKNLMVSSLAAVNNIWKIVQAPVPEKPPEKFPIIELYYEPYLTINAETDINASLKVKEKITTPILSLTKAEQEGILKVADLTADREYLFPNLSGTVCLSTGNCIGLGGGVIGVGGLPNRLAKFISANRLGPASIADFYTGVAINIDSTGRVGIGTTEPKYNLHVQGRIQATGDVCTDIGGKCLSQISTGAFFFGGGGIAGVGTSGHLPIWTDTTVLGDSIVSQSGSTLTVAGTMKMTGFQLTTGAQPGYILTSDASGVGTWQPTATGTIPGGTTGQTLRHDGTNWVANSFLYNTGSAIGIGTTSTVATLTVAGDGYFTGPLTIATSTLSQLVLKYNDDNYLRFLISSTSSEILSSKTMVINSLTGEVRLGDNVTAFNATSSTIRGATFISAANDSTVRKSGEKVFRASIPIFLFPVPAQTTSTEFVAVTREISTSTLNATLPDTLPGATRKFAYLLNFADDIPASTSSTWLVDDLTNGTDIEFTFAGQNFSDLDKGAAHLSNLISPLTNNWQLKVKVPSGNAIRIFNIFLLTYDQIQ